MLTQAEYQNLRQKYDSYHAERERVFPKKNGLTKEDQAQLPPSPTNSEISAIEVFEFVTNPRARYFGYISEEKREMTTWTGDTLGVVSFGPSFRSNMGDTRVPITVRAINGKTYHGLYFKSAGDYCRVKIGKG